MSLILDALKKSETERQQQATPGIADVPTAQPVPSSSRWLPIVMILLAVNLAAVLYLLLRPDPQTAPAIAAMPERAATGDAATTNAAPVATTAESTTALPPATSPQPAVTAPLNAEPDEVAVAAVPEATAAGDAMDAEAAEEVPATTTAAAPNVAATDEAPPVRPAAASETESYLTINDLRASGGFNLPEMHIDLHVYSNDPAERFVFINMNQYRENATTEEGPRVREITTEGVILEHRGSVFLLPRE